MNVRKAQKHMQRATELLNLEGQLGFGGPDDRVITRAMKRKMEALEEELQKKQKVEAEANLDLNMDSDEVEANRDLNMVSDKVITDLLHSCEDVCKWQAASRRFRDAEINKGLKEKLSLDVDKPWTLYTACQKCQQKKMRLKSMSEEERNTKLHESHKEELESQASFQTRGDLELMNNIDIIVTMTGVGKCVLYKDVNGNFTKYQTNQKRLNEFFKNLNLLVYKNNTPNEYWVVERCEIFFCTAHQSLKKMIKRIKQKEFPVGKPP